jgi:hypothetical protein
MRGLIRATVEVVLFFFGRVRPFSFMGVDLGHCVGSFILFGGS